MTKSMFTAGFREFPLVSLDVVVLLLKFANSRIREFANCNSQTFVNNPKNLRTTETIRNFVSRIPGHLFVTTRKRVNLFINENSDYLRNLPK